MLQLLSTVFGVGGVGGVLLFYGKNVKSAHGSPNAPFIVMNNSFSTTYGLGNQQGYEEAYYLKRISKGWVYRAFPGRVTVRLRSGFLLFAIITTISIFLESTIQTKKIEGTLKLLVSLLLRLQKISFINLLLIFAF